MTAPLTRRIFVAALVAAPSLASAAETGGLPPMVVTKDPTCGCCAGWTEHVRAAGFAVEVVETAELNRVKARLQVPHALAACHTAEVDGFVVEGHVPAAVIKRVLAERPKATGVAVRGMPIGSPGMEMEGERPERYDVILFGPAGQSVFARCEGDREV
jgi:hypothetical protein